MMTIFQAIKANNAMLVDALGQAEPVLRRACDRIAERVRRGGRIFCLNAASDVPVTYAPGNEVFVPVSCAQGSAWQTLQGCGAKAADVVLAPDAGDSPDLADDVRACRRKGLLTVCITCETASAAASSSEVAIRMAVEPALENRALKCAAARRMALDALLTEVMDSLGHIGTADAYPAKTSSMDKAVAALMAELPGLDADAAMQLIVRYGTVRKAVKAYKDNVQAEL